MEWEFRFDMGDGIIHMYVGRLYMDRDDNGM